MKRYSFLLVLFAFTPFVGCSSSTETVQQQASSDQPVIYGFLQDTVGVNWTAYVYGRHLEYCKVWLGDSLMTPTDSLSTTLISFRVPQWASTDYVYAGLNAASRTRSPKPLVISTPQLSTTFRIGNISKTTATAGERIVIYGSRLLDEKDSLTILYNNLFLPIESITNDSIVVHLPQPTASASLQIIYQNAAIATFGITIVRPLIWRHVTINVVGYEYTATHRRYGYVDFRKKTFDTTWSEHAKLDESWTFDIMPASLSPTGSRFQLSSYLTQKGSPGALQLNLTWDSVQQYILCVLSYGAHKQSILPVSITDDTSFSLNTTISSRSLNADAEDSLMIPFSVVSYLPQISFTHAESDHNGEYSWTETATAVSNSNFGVGRLIFILKP